MPGTETNNYDMVIELAENTIVELLKSIFDSGGYLDQILDAMHLSSLKGKFNLQVSLDKPDINDIRIPEDAESPVDITIFFGENDSGNSLRFVAGIDVNRDQDNVDIICINLKEKLYYSKMTVNIAGFTFDLSILAELLKNTIKMIPLLPFPVQRDTIDPIITKALDVKVIDGAPSGGDKDAIAYLLSYGGSLAGNKNGFTKSFIPDKGAAAIGIFFKWILRMISPQIEEALHLPAGSFSDGIFDESEDGEVLIEGSDDVFLKRFSLSIEDGYINASASVRTSGFCYSITGTLSGKVKIELVNGVLTVAPEIGEPTVDVDIPILCWIGAIVLGVIIGGLIAVITEIIATAIIGVLVPLLMWALIEGLEGAVNDALKKLTDSLNSLVTGANIPMLDTTLSFLSVTIDDIKIKCKMVIDDNVPIHSRGIARLNYGEAIDLDTGKIGNNSLYGADLLWMGSNLTGSLQTVCITELAKTNLNDFESIKRYHLYQYSYSQGVKINANELACVSWDSSFPWFDFDFIDETNTIFAVRTNEERYSVVRINKMELNYLEIEYKTFEKNIPVIEIKGGFGQKKTGFTFNNKLEFMPYSKELRYEFGNKKEELFKVINNKTKLNFSDALNKELHMLQKSKPVNIRLKNITSKNGFTEKFGRIGHWEGLINLITSDVGNFYAVVHSGKAPFVFQWKINGKALTGTSGTADVYGNKINYTIKEGNISVEAVQKKATLFELSLTFFDGDKNELHAVRCVEYKPIIQKIERLFPVWADYHKKYLEVVDIKPLKTM